MSVLILSRNQEDKQGPTDIYWELFRNVKPTNLRTGRDVADQTGLISLLRSISRR